MKGRRAIKKPEPPKRGGRKTAPPAAKRGRTRVVAQPPECTARGCHNFATGEDGLCDECRVEFEETALEDRRQTAERYGFQQRRVSKEGFDQLKIQWTGGNTHFRFPTQSEVDFYGWYRKMSAGGELVHAIDIFAQVKSGESAGREFAVESIPYAHDPRVPDVRSVNADICAAANRWFFERVNADVDTLNQIIKQAKRPTFIINHLGTLDSLILRLKEVRKTALISGGTRVIEIKGDRDAKDVVGVLQINLTAQAMALDGKIPTLKSGVMYDAVLRDDNGSTAPEPIRVEKPAKRGRVVDMTDNDEKPNRPQRLDVKPATGNVKDLIDRLKAAKDAGDKSTQRKIRAALRSMGHRGGARGMEKGGK